MADTDTSRVPTGSVLLALGLLVAGVQLPHHATLVEFTYHVTETTESAATAAAQAADDQTTAIYRFAELSSTAQDAFLRAHEATDGRIKIRGMDNQVTSLRHFGDTGPQPGQGLYYVLYQDTHYKFEIRHPMSMIAHVLILGYLSAASSILYTLYLGLRHGPRSQRFLAPAAGIACFLAAYGLTDWWTLTTLSSLLVVGALAAYVPAFGVWTLYDSRSS